MDRVFQIAIRGREMRRFAGGNFLSGGGNLTRSDFEYDSWVPMRLKKGAKFLLSYNMKIVGGREEGGVWNFGEE